MCDKSLTHILLPKNSAEPPVRKTLAFLKQMQLTYSPKRNVKWISAAQKDKNIVSFRLSAACSWAGPFRTFPIAIFFHAAVAVILPYNWRFRRDDSPIKNKIGRWKRKNEREIK